MTPHIWIVRWTLAGLVLTLTGPGGLASDFVQWSALLPESQRAFAQDPDGDGVPNGLEYLAGTDPQSPEGSPGVQVQFGLVEEWGDRQPRLEVEIPLVQPADLVSCLEVSRDLVSWIPVASCFGSGSWVMHEGTLTAARTSTGSMALRWTGMGLEPTQSGVYYRFSAGLLDGADGDGDGLADQWERQYGLDPVTDDAGMDTDGDGLTHLAEQQAGTHPLQADTDGDGTYDGCQLAAGGTARTGAVAQAETGLLVLTP